MAERDGAAAATSEDAPNTESAFAALARTLHLDQLRDVSLSATIRRGTIVAPLHTAIPGTRSADVLAPTETPTLPLLDVDAPPDRMHGADLELVRALGEGGMGVVWLAKQRSLARDVAVKRLKTRGGSSADARALVREARATGALEHPSIVPVHALGVGPDGSPLLVMKRIEGESLEALIRDADHAAWPALERRHGDRLAAIVEILMRVSDALQLAHARGIIHRDIKPENVMVGSFGEVYLVDWGVALWPDALEAEELHALSIVGTPGFMAPEMVRGDARHIDARTDVYLLGATLHAALTGSPRHGGDTVSSTLLAALWSRPVTYDPDTGELGELANRATSPDPKDRPESALAFREALLDFVRHRASARLAQEARARLDGLSSGDGTIDLLTSPEATQALTESRFAFTQALREWSGNVVARDGLDRTLRKMIESEIARRSPDAAEALLRELDGGDEALRARIERVRVERAESSRLEDQARHDARERDPARTARQRAGIAGGLIALTLILVAFGLTSELSNNGARPMTEALLYDGVLLGFVALLVVVFRASLLANRIGRQITLALVTVLVAGGVSDVLLWIRGGDTHAAGSASMLAMASVLAGAAIGIDARFALSAAAFLGGAIVCAVWPSMTVLAVGGAAIVAAGIVMVDSIRQARAPEK